MAFFEDLLNMPEEDFIMKTSMALMVSLVAACSILCFTTHKAPYGKHGDLNWVNIKLPAKVAWFFQEMPCLVMAAVSFASRTQFNSVNTVLLTMFVFHYVNRALVFPFRIRGGKPWDVLVFTMACAFCLINGYLVTKHLMVYALYPDDWATRPQFVIGSALFSVGWAINFHSDGVLRGLRRPGESGYKIPTEGCFRYVSCANYFGEMVEWCGFALAACTLPTFSFAFGTVLNLLPRAISYHEWYHRKFDDYPKDRKILVPFIF
eukprot:TRINITY_DN266_c1_g1_i1.p1 TRINITY_DN266_c1_g1~~TRINITY_DN266_c1_g1_i1.p1  ORF type:complete len:263 (+),score=17.55 TRINITY_DN266_c1_g1_i1:77-865(+)